jgi:citrate lyase subunit alpha/citrate CoA-transferase
MIAGNPTMASKPKLIKNAAGRLVPQEVNGVPQTPFKGVGKFKPDSSHASPQVVSCAHYPADGNKTVKSLKAALEKCGLKDGMTISSHHHFRNGDLVMNQVFDIAADIGVQGLRWFPSAAFPCHEPIIRHMENGVVDWVEGSLNGPLGYFASQGNMRGIAVLRSHGGRWQAVQDGEVHIDIAVIAAPTADAFGNATGDQGPSACGLLGFGLVDSIYADKVIVVTDNLVPFPCVPWQIQGQHVDYVVVLQDLLKKLEY